MKNEYYIVYGWSYDGESDMMWPVPWCVTENKEKAIRYFSVNTDESLQLIIVKTKLNPECFDLNKISEKLTDYANRYDGNKLAWSAYEWVQFTTNYDGEEPKIFELNLN